VKPRDAALFDAEDPVSVSAIDDLSLWAAPFGLALLDAIIVRKNMSVLDLGCGLGFPLVEISQRLGRSSRIYGLDPWRGGLQRVKVKTDVFGISNVWTVQGEAESMPFKDNLFDLIVSNNGINNVRSMETAVSECRRICREGAQLVVTVNLEETMMEFYDVLACVLTENGLDKAVTAMRKHIHSKRKPLDETQAILESSEFQILDVRRDVFKLKYADGTTMLNSVLIKHWFAPAWENVVPASERDGVFRETESRLNVLAESNGETVLTVPFVTIDCRCRKSS
jgi:ubiquinone/menaquinone biosynthesis C-methylase UbiE